MIEVYSTASPPMPAPRLIARSMLSLGTEVFFALSTASKSVGLPCRSAPPSLAATSMFLMSLAHDLARRASMTAFLCFVVAHLECPDIYLHSSFPPVVCAQGVDHSSEPHGRRLVGPRTRWETCAHGRARACARRRAPVRQRVPEHP